MGYILKRSARNKTTSMNLINYLILTAVFSVFCLGGFSLLYWFNRKRKKFTWGIYGAMLAFPLACVIYSAYLFGNQILILFLLSSVIGFSLEYLLGFFYYKILHQKLWIYGHYKMGDYTSFLTLPMWGAAGLVFYIISKIAGL